MTDLFSALAAPAAEDSAPLPASASTPASPHPYGHLEHVGCRVVWHAGPAILYGQEWADLPIRIRTRLIVDFIRMQKVRMILAQPDKAARRLAIDRFRNIAGDVETERVMVLVREAWQQLRGDSPPATGVTDGR